MTRVINEELGLLKSLFISQSTKNLFYFNEEPVLRSIVLNVIDCGPTKNINTNYTATDAKSTISSLKVAKYLIPRSSSLESLL